MSLSVAGPLELDDPCGRFQPWQFCGGVNEGVFYTALKRCLVPGVSPFLRVLLFDVHYVARNWAVRAPTRGFEVTLNF